MSFLFIYPYTTLADISDSPPTNRLTVMDYMDTMLGSMVCLYTWYWNLSHVIFRRRHAAPRFRNNLLSWLVMWLDFSSWPLGCVQFWIQMKTLSQCRGYEASWVVKLSDWPAKPIPFHHPLFPFPTAYSLPVMFIFPLPHLSFPHSFSCQSSPFHYLILRFFWQWGFISFVPGLLQSVFLSLTSTSLFVLFFSFPCFLRVVS